MNEMKAKHHTVPPLLCLLAASLLLSACGNRSTAPDDNAAIAGAYALVSVNGNRVPARVSHQGASLEVRSGTLTLNADGTCRSETTFVPPAGSAVHREVSATYTRHGSELTMRWKGAGTTRATISSNTLAMNNEGTVFEYAK